VECASEGAAKLPSSDVVIVGLGRHVWNDICDGRGLACINAFVDGDDFAARRVSAEVEFGVRAVSVASEALFVFAECVLPIAFDPLFE